jgi:hypothetical protein
MIPSSASLSAIHPETTTNRPESSHFAVDVELLEHRRRPSASSKAQYTQDTNPEPLNRLAGFVDGHESRIFDEDIEVCHGLFVTTKIKNLPLGTT